MMSYCIRKTVSVKHVLSLSQPDPDIVNFVKCVCLSLIIIVFGNLINDLGSDNALVKKITNILSLYYCHMPYFARIWHSLEQFHCMIRLIEWAL